MTYMETTHTEHGSWLKKYFILQVSASGYKILIASQVQGKMHVSWLGEGEGGGGVVKVPVVSILLTSGLKAIYKVAVGELSQFKSVLHCV